MVSLDFIFLCDSVLVSCVSIFFSFFYFKVDYFAGMQVILEVSYDPFNFCDISCKVSLLIFNFVDLDFYPLDYYS